jgi:hypothetical protein
MIASIADIANVAMRVTSIPNPTDVPVGTIVQLCHPQSGYILGHYYLLDSTEGWVDVSHNVPLEAQKAEGLYILLNNRLFLVWGDPPGTSDVEWVRTNIYLEDNNNAGESGRILVASSDVPNANPDGLMVKLTAEQVAIQNKSFISVAIFSDGTEVTATLKKFSISKAGTASVIDGTLCKTASGEDARMVYSKANGMLTTSTTKIEYTVQNDCFLVVDFSGGEVEGWNNAKEWKDYLDVYAGNNIVGKLVDNINDAPLNIDAGSVSFPVKAGTLVTIKGSGSAKLFGELDDEATLTISELHLSEFGAAEDVFVKAVQADWAEKDTTSSSYIRNKPCLIRKMYIDVNGHLILITDEPASSTDFYIDDDGNLIMELPDDDSDEFKE